MADRGRPRCFVGAAYVFREAGVEVERTELRTLAAIVAADRTVAAET